MAHAGAAPLGVTVVDELESLASCVTDEGMEPSACRMPRRRLKNAWGKITERGKGGGKRGQRACCGPMRTDGSEKNGVPVNEEPHSLLSVDATVVGRKSPRLWEMSEYAPLTQSVQVTFEGMVGTEPLSMAFVAIDSMFETERVPV